MTDAEMCAEVRSDDVDEKEATSDETGEQPSGPVSIVVALEHIEGTWSFLDQHSDGAAAMQKRHEFAIAR